MTKLQSQLLLALLLPTVWLSALLHPTSVSAQVTPAPGPFGGKVNAIVSTGEFLFAATETGDVYVSKDNGGRWQATNVGNNHLEVLSLAADGTTVYAGTRNGGIFRTSDNGAAWKQLIAPREVIGKNITALRMIGKQLFVGTDIEGLMLLQGGELIPRSEGLISTSVQFIMAQGNAIYVATGDGPARSTDGGETWQMILNDLPELNWSHTVITANGKLFTAGSKGIFTSTDKGNSWNGFIQAQIGEGYCELWQSGGMLVAELRQSGAWISSDDGATWKQMENAPADILDITTHRGALVAAAATGIYRSNDKGQTWQPQMNGVTATAVNGLVEFGEMVFAATENGVYGTAKGETRWQRFPAGPDRWVHSLEKHNGALYAGMNYGGIQRTTDNGASWVPLSGGYPEEKQVSQLVSDGSRLYAATWGGLFATTDGGETWQNIPIGANTDGVMTTLVASGDTLWAAISGEGIFTSTDAGASWKRMTKGLPAGADINQLAWQGETLHAIVRTFPSFGLFVDRLYSYNPATKSWRATPGGPANVAEITALISATNQLVVATSQGLYSSATPGKPFKLMKSGIASARCGVLVGDSIWFGTSWSGVQGVRF